MKLFLKNPSSCTDEKDYKIDFQSKTFNVIATYRISNRGSWLVESRTALKFEFVSPFLM